MIVASNQPYLFPYLGYFQLIAGADIFVASDAMQYENRSWINRNNLLIGGKIQRITSPVKRFGRFYLPINERYYDANFLKKWIKGLHYNYSHAACYRQVMNIVEKLEELKIDNVADFNIMSIKIIADYLEIKTEIKTLSELGIDLSCDRTEKTIRIIRKIGADKYINLPGGRKLYNVDYFASQGIDLKFLNPYLPEYPQQRTQNFHPGLSILDVMMNCPVEQIQEMLRGATFSH